MKCWAVVILVLTVFSCGSKGRRSELDTAPQWEKQSLAVYLEQLTNWAEAKQKVGVASLHQALKRAGFVVGKSGREATLERRVDDFVVKDVVSLAANDEDVILGGPPRCSASISGVKDAALFQETFRKERFGPLAAALSSPQHLRRKVGGQFNGGSVHYDPSDDGVLPNKFMVLLLFSSTTVQLHYSVWRKDDPGIFESDGETVGEWVVYQVG